MHRLWKLSTLSGLLRLLLAVIFIYASFDKIRHPADFAAIVGNYKVLPESLINLTAIILPWLELVLGALLLLGRWLEGAFLLVNLLLLTFWAVLVSNYFRGIDINCGCFSTKQAEAQGMLRYMLRDVFFVFLGIGAAWIHCKISGAVVMDE